MSFEAFSAASCDVHAFSNMRKAAASPGSSEEIESGVRTFQSGLVVRLEDGVNSRMKTKMETKKISARVWTANESKGISSCF